MSWHRCVLWHLWQSGQANAAAAAAAGGGDDPTSHHPSRLNSIGATGGRGLQSTPGVSRPGDGAPPTHEYSVRPHAEAAQETHINSRLTADHAAAASCTSGLITVTQHSGLQQEFTGKAFIINVQIKLQKLWYVGDTLLCKTWAFQNLKFYAVGSYMSWLVNNVSLQNISSTAKNTQN